MNEKKIDELLALEDRLKAEIQDMTESIRIAVAGENLTGVKKLGANCASVSLGAVRASGKLMLDPGYFLQEKQAEAVARKLSKCDRVTDAISYIKEILEKNEVVLGREKIPMNPSTMRAIKKSVLGQFAAMSSCNLENT